MNEQPLFQEFLQCQSYLEEILQTELFLTSQLLHFLSGLAFSKQLHEIKESPSSNEEERKNEILYSLKEIRSTRILQSKIFGILFTRIYGQKLDHEFLNKIDFKTSPFLCDLYFLRDHLISLLERLNIEALNEKLNTQKLQKKEQPSLSPSHKRKKTTLLD